MQIVVAAVAGQDIGGAVAGAVKIIRSGENKVLEGGGKDGVEDGLQRIDPAIDLFHGLVADGVDDEQVIARAADHAVVAAATVQRIRPGAANQRVMAAKPAEKVCPAVARQDIG